MSSTSKVIVMMVFAIMMMVGIASAQNSTQNGTVGDVDITPDPVGNVTVNATVNKTGDGNVTVLGPDINNTGNATGNETASDDTADRTQLVVVLIAMGILIAVIIVVFRVRTPRKPAGADALGPEFNFRKKKAKKNTTG